MLQELRKMLRDVRAHTGFDDEGKRLLVRYFYGGDGGCEMYITKLSDPAGDKSGGRASSAGTSVRNLNGTIIYRRDAGGRADARVVYRFAELGELIGACRALRAAGYSGRSAAFSDRTAPRLFYLILDRESPVIAEFNGRRLPDVYYFFVKEHFISFSGDPVSVLGSMC